MKKKLLMLLVMVVAVMSVFAITVSAENNIIKLDTLPTLDEIHANPEAYVSRLDEFENGEDYETYRETDPDSVVVMFDKAETPTYYVFPAYYVMRSTYYYITAGITTLNETIAAADESAFSGYTSAGGTYGKGECDYLVRIEVPKYVTTITDNYKFQESVNLKEVYFPTHIVIDEETGLEKEVAYVTTITGTNLANGCTSLEYMHNSDKLPSGIINENGFYNCSSLKEIKIPETVTSISRGCFNKCSSLKEVILPNSVTKVCKLAFANCTNLETFSFGAGFTTFVRENYDYETFLYSQNLKYVYLPSTFADSITATNNDFKNIFNTMNKNVTYFFAGLDYDKSLEIQNKFVATNANKSISGAKLVEYDEEIDYKTYADTLGYSIIVYNYDICKAFYKGIHNYKGTGNCVEGVTCTQCSDNIATFTDHVYAETLTYDSFIAVGVYNKYCTNASDCTVGKIVNEETNPIFQAKEENGYSTNGTGIAFGGYTVDVDALNEFNRVNKDAPLNFGVVLMNPAYIGDTFFENGAPNATKGYLVADMSDTQYSNIKVMIDGFTGNAAELELVISLYAYTDTDAVEFIQSEDTKSANSKVIKGKTTLYTVSVNSVMNKPYASIDALPKYGEEE